MRQGICLVDLFMSETLRDVYTAEEVARAAGVPIGAVRSADRRRGYAPERGDGVLLG